MSFCILHNIAVRNFNLKLRAQTSLRLQDAVVKLIRCKVCAKINLEEV